MVTEVSHIAKKVQACIESCREEGFTPDAFGVAESICDNEMASGELDQSELEIAFHTYETEAKRQLTNA